MSPLPSLLALTVLLLALPARHHARRLADSDPPAPSPSSGGKGGTDIDDILEENGQFKTFLRLLDQTQTDDQIENQLKNNDDVGMTVFAPTDNAFANLKPGTVNGLTPQQKTQLVQYHIVPKFYNLTTLQDASNPVRTQANGQNGGLWGLNVTSQNNQVNVSSGNVVAPVNNALTKGPPLMVFEINQVLLPEELFSEKNDTGAGAGSPPPGGAPGKSGSSSPAGAPEGSGAGGRVVAVGVVVGVLGFVGMAVGL